eukprot:10676992-Alexandrium_andersonii.AAC.1
MDRRHSNHCFDSDHHPLIGHKQFCIVTVVLWIHLRPMLAVSARQIWNSPPPGQPNEQEQNLPPGLQPTGYRH